MTEILSGSAGDQSAGKLLYAQKCGLCHKLFGEGKSIGPPLDGYERGSLKFWLTSIVAPSLEIREGYQSYLALTDDGRVVTGMMAAQDPNTITLRTAGDGDVILVRKKLDEFRAIQTSLMPDNALAEMTDQQIRDLFAYLTLGTNQQ